MKVSIAFLALAVAGAVVPAETPAYADPAPAPAADLEMVYGHPEVAADNSGVTWPWVLTNKGVAAAGSVVATHRLSAGQTIVGVSQPCAAGQAGDVVCRFAAMRPGEKRTGWIRTAVAPAGGTMRINAQVTWKEDPGILPDLGSPVDAGAADSWGVSGTDTATRVPDAR